MDNSAQVGYEVDPRVGAEISADVITSLIITEFNPADAENSKLGGSKRNAQTSVRKAE